MEWPRSLLGILASVVLLGGCNIHDLDGSERRFPYSKADNFPYGVWRSQSGYYVEVRRDGTYRVCSERRCDEGRVEFFGRFGIRLLDFSVPEKPVAMAILDQSGYRERRAVFGHDVDQDFDFSPNVGPPLIEELCDGRPCVDLGVTDHPEFLFVLEEAER